jgi:hypothetical protein
MSSVNQLLLERVRVAERAVLFALILSLAAGCLFPVAPQKGLAEHDAAVAAATCIRGMSVDMASAAHIGPIVSNTV